MSRPEYITCIADTHQSHIGYALCGRKIGGFAAKTESTLLGDAVVKSLRPWEMVFMDIDHWFHNARRHGRLIGCQKCLEQLREVVGRDLSLSKDCMEDPGE